VGNDSHKKLACRLTEVVALPTLPTAVQRRGNARARADGPGDRVMVRTVIQSSRAIPFPDSAAPILQQFGDEREGSSPR